MSTRYIARCKDCKTATSALQEGRNLPLANNLAAAYRAKGVYRFANGNLCLNCRSCGKPRYAKAVRGVYSAKHVCAAKCLASTGTSCECSCGGKNHGASWGGQ